MEVDCRLWQKLREDLAAFSNTSVVNPFYALDCISTEVRQHLSENGASKAPASTPPPCPLGNRIGKRWAETWRRELTLLGSMACLNIEWTRHQPL